MLFLVFLLKESLISLSFSLNQSWCLRDTGPMESIVGEITVLLKTVQVPSTSSELCI